ncbi:DUF305 domain-containing protein [Actinoplanes sp. TFC3]|uniref:DUF305 domain-containing protein n=1 Tax=Actinoplanes sp. TFC3 TaxID=1710355 RepID=UPI000834940E|nr:DUF305 domain-containing protein [Actinoplanes sp. TFC3]
MVLLTMGACSASATDGTGTTTTPAASANSAGTAGFFGGTDLAWIEITIAMDEELLPLLALVPANSQNDQLKALSADISAFHEAELTSLRALHDEAKLPAENPHKGMPMPGMVTPEQVSAATAEKGPAFDKLVVGHLRAHFDQGVNLAGSEGKAGIEPRTKALADNVISSRRTYLDKLGTFH